MHQKVFKLISNHSGSNVKYLHTYIAFKCKHSKNCTFSLVSHFIVVITLLVFGNPIYFLLNGTTFISKMQSLSSTAEYACCVHENLPLFLANAIQLILLVCLVWCLLDCIFEI